MIEDHARSIFFETLDPRRKSGARILMRPALLNVELRARVDQLLLAHGSIGHINGGHTSTPPADPREVLLEGRGLLSVRTGCSRRLAKVGSASFTCPNRFSPFAVKVALKILKPGMDHAAGLARFEAERQGARAMDHPNIAKFSMGARPRPGADTSSWSSFGASQSPSSATRTYSPSSNVWSFSSTSARRFNMRIKRESSTVT